MHAALKPEHGTCQFMRVDVTDYKAQLALFRSAYEKHDRVDMAIYSAGINEMGASGTIVSTENNLKTVENVSSRE